MLQNYNKILIKVPYSQLYYNKTQIKISTKIRIFYAPQFFKGQNRKKCANYASKYGTSFSEYCRVLCNGWKWRFRAKYNVQLYEPKRPGW